MSGTAGGFAGSAGASLFGDFGLGRTGYGLSGAASGALGSLAAGGNPWEGAISGGIIGAFNHGGHGTPEDPYQLPEVVCSAPWIPSALAGGFGSIRPARINNWEKMRANWGIPGRVIYGSVDDIWVMAQRISGLRSFNEISHLDNSGLVGSDLTDAGIGVLTDRVPIGKFSKVLEISKKTVNIGQFNRLVKGGFTRTISPAERGFMTRQFNNTVNQVNSFNSTYKIINTSGGIISHSLNSY